MECGESGKYKIICKNLVYSICVYVYTYVYVHIYVSMYMCMRKKKNIKIYFFLTSKFELLDLLPLLIA